jgi:hypothetical protein
VVTSCVSHVCCCCCCSQIHGAVGFAVSIIAGQTHVTSMRAVRGHRWGGMKDGVALLVSAMRREGDGSGMLAGGAEDHTIIMVKTLIFHQDGFFFTSWNSVDWYQKNIPLLLSHLEVPLILEGYVSKIVWYLRRASQAKMECGMEDGYFLLAIARHSLME